MVFQFELPFSIESIENGQHQCIDHISFGKSSFTNHWESIFDRIFQQCVDSQYSVKTINDAIFAEVQIGCQVPPPNVVILEAGPEANKDESIHQCINMYLADLGQNVIDLVGDEAIYRRTKSFKNDDLTGRFMLGQWHTSKAMCSAILTGF